MSAITPELITHVAHLARLRLDGGELAQLTAQLDEIVRYVQQLQAIDVADIEPTTHVLPLANVLRADEPRPSLEARAVLAMAPAAKPPFVTVPKVIDQGV